MFKVASGARKAELSSPLMGRHRHIMCLALLHAYVYATWAKCSEQRWCATAPSKLSSKGTDAVDTQLQVHVIFATFIYRHEKECRWLRKRALHGVKILCIFLMCAFLLSTELQDLDVCDFDEHKTFPRFVYVLQLVEGMSMYLQANWRKNGSQTCVRRLDNVRGEKLDPVD